MELIATCTFGLEKLVREELKSLDLWIIKTEDGKITFEGDEDAISKANLNLRCASRIEIKMGEFEAVTFDQLFDQTNALEWEKFIGQKDQFPVKATSTKSALHSEPAIQSIVKKAIVKRLQKAHKTELLPENSEAIYQITVKCNKDQFVIGIDSSGDSLHKRGYRMQTTDAPIKETLAASMVKLSDWTTKHEVEDRKLIDPFCGSGTILIEAALIAKDLAPGHLRQFAFEKWPWIKKSKIEKNKKTQTNPTNQPIRIFGFDIDKRAIKIAKDNAKRAGVEDMISFSCSDFNDLDFNDFENSTFVTNPPYGERLEETAEVTRIYRQLGEKFRQIKSYSLFLITPREDFTHLFGRREDKNRKLFNGNLKCYLYSITKV